MGSVLSSPENFLENRSAETLWLGPMWGKEYIKTTLKLHYESTPKNCQRMDWPNCC